jgi:hypothetical protein
VIKNNLNSNTLTITDGSSAIFIETSMDENINVLENDTLGLSIKQVGSSISGENFKSQVIVKRLVQWE